MDELSLQYMAGFVDGEGCVCIHENRAYSARTSCRAPRVVLQLNVANCHLRVLQQMQKQFGGNIRTHLDKYNPNARTSYRWCLSEQAAAGLLEQLLPYLVVKREVAELAIRLGHLKAANSSRRGVKRHRLTLEEAEERIAIAKRCRELNKRGRDGEVER